MFTLLRQTQPTVSALPVAVRFFLAVLSFFSAFPVGAQEAVWNKMLEGLKAPERQYYDTAAEYLESMRTSPLCPPDLKPQIDYQIALVHFEAVENQAMFLTLKEHFEQCRKALEKYINEQPNGEWFFESQSLQGGLYKEEGHIAVLKSEHERTKDDERPTLLKEAREHFQKALPYFEAADRWATEQAKKLQAAQKANAASVKEDELFTAYGRFLSGKILIQLTKSEIAKTYPKDSSEFKDGLTAAGKEFSNLAVKYSEYSAGFDAKLYAAKIYKELGDFRTARTLLGELNTLTGDQFMKVRSESLMLALEMNLIDKKLEGYRDSMRRVGAWNENVSASVKVSQDGQKIFLLGAKTFIAYAESVSANKEEHDRAVREAGIFLRQIRPAYPPIAKEAAQLLRKIGAVKIDRGNPANYEQAKEFAEEDWQNFATVYAEFQESTDTAKKAEVKTRLDKIADDCAVSLNRAVSKKEANTLPAEVNALRKNLVTIYWYQGKLLEAADLAADLTLNHSDAPDAEKTAVMAVRLYRQLFVQEKQAGKDTTTLAERLQKVCDFILTQWEGQEAAGEVQVLQIETEIDNGKVENAQALLAKIAEGTPQRVSAELKIGQLLWNRYAVLQKTADDSETAVQKIAAQTERTNTLAESKKWLETGLNGKVKLIQEGKDKPDAASVQCALVLAQIELNDGESQRCIDWLHNAETGPLTLLDRPVESVSAELLKELQLNAVMFLLRAYVALENLDKAEETMNRLETVIKEQNADEQKLTQIYVSLGRHLENRLKELTESGEIEQAEKVANGFELFLKRIAGRNETNSFQITYWTADTFYRLGSGMSTEQNVPVRAAGYYKQAGDIYNGILKRLAVEPNWSPPNAVETIRVRLAESLRCAGQYEEAMELILETLKKTENRLDVQVEAAKTLQAWGKKDPKKLLYAAAGRYPSAQVWGWNGLIKRTSTNIERFSEVYYEAYWNKFYCALEIVKTEKDAAKKQRILEGAQRDFTSLIQMRPQLGGQEWYAQFDRMFRQVERAQGTDKPGGIKGLQKKLSEMASVEPAKAESAQDETPSSTDVKPAARKDSGAMLTIVICIGAVLVMFPVCYLMFRKKK